jgi:hypothetical protein
MANFTGRLALPCENPDAGLIINLATSPLALRTFALRAYYSAQLSRTALSRPRRGGWKISGNALHEIRTIVEEPKGREANAI